MKTDREFLDGMWSKAGLLQSGDAASSRPSVRLGRRPMAALLGTAAVIALACTAFAINGVSRQPVMAVPAGYESLQPVQPRVSLLSLESEDEKISSADLILLAKATKIGESVYTPDNQSILTPVTFLPETVYKGEWPADELVVGIDGGVDHENRCYVEYQAVFSPGEEALLFLSAEENGRLALMDGGKYALAEQDFVSPEGVRMTGSELCEKVKQALEQSASDAPATGGK